MLFSPSFCTRIAEVVSRWFARMACWVIVLHAGVCCDGVLSEWEGGLLV